MDRGGHFFAARSGLTLIELLVVIAILSSLLALGGFAVHNLSDTRSVQAGHDLLHARISEARARAMADGRSTGLLLFPDVRTQRTAVAPIQFSERARGELKLLRYEAWSNLFPYSASPNGDARDADQVVHVVKDLAGPPDLPNSTAGKPVIYPFQCSIDTPPNTIDPDEMPLGRHWQPLGLSEDVELIGDMSLLPEGVAAQLITGDIVGQRYVRVGAIVFDQTGRMEFRSFRVRSGSALSELIFGTTAQEILPIVPGRIAGIHPQWGGAQVGFAIYLNREFRDKFGDFDISQDDPLPGAPAAALSRETTLESWVNDNATPFLVNRFSGQGGLAQ